MINYFGNTNASKIRFGFQSFIFYFLSVEGESFSLAYVFAFPSKPKALAGFSPYLTVTNLASYSVTVDVIFDTADYGLTSVVAENGDKTLELPTLAFLPNSNGITNRTIIVCSSGEVSLYGFVSESKEDATMFSVDQFMNLDPWDKYIRGAYLALPAKNLGTEHYIVAYPKQQRFYISIYGICFGK